MHPSGASVDRMAVAELKQRLDRGEPLTVLDVREDHERAFCAIPLPVTAADLHIPMAQVPAQLDVLRAAASAAPLVVYCHHGMRSMTVAGWLARRGVEAVCNLEGGIDAWSERVDPGIPRY
ncbi:MAG: rhodanese [Planctomycetaceae bacterium]|nr:rhodanese [Planctomycetaceae bacterium]MBV8264815.1 rhodanese [Planctomycetaceae bacterium]MBV8608745.1 sulfurtransferase [Singulisphaera sp.]MBV8677739.1 rhodanese [Planctomycetaceae bacterium]